MTPEQERKLLEMAQSGHKHSFGLLVADYQARLRAYAARFVLNYDDVYELVQDSFLEAWRNLDKFDTSREFMPWIRSICKHKILNHLHHKSRPAHPCLSFIDEDFVDRASLETDIPSDEAVEKIEALKKCIEKLKDKYRNIIQLRYYQNMAVKEIAQRLNQSATSVSMLIVRIRSNLEKCMKQRTTHDTI